MTFGELDAAYATYLNDRDTGHALYSACVAFALSVVSVNNAFRHEIACDSAWRAMERLETIKPDTTFAVWFLRLVKNRQRDVWRMVNARARYESSGFRPSTTPFSFSEQDAMRERAGEHREIIDRLLDGYTLEEIASSLGISTRTLRRRLLSLKESAKNV